jgi:WD40 repeat protein
VAISADAARIATVADDGTVLLWRTEDMQRLHELDHGGPAGRVAFSPDGRRLVTAGDVVRVWAAAIGEHLLTLAPGAPVCDVVFSAHGDRIATAGADGAARIWDSLTGDELDRLDHDAEVHAVAFAPGGQGLVTSSGQGKVRTWRPDGRHADTERSATVTTITFSPDGLLRAEGGDSGQIWITEVGSP